VEQELSFSGESYAQVTNVVSHRTAIDNLLAGLPAYGSKAFWHRVTDVDKRTDLPLEIFVKCVRIAVACGDNAGRNRLIEIIFRRTAIINETWATNILKDIPLQPDERKALISDLYADLCEHVIRAVIDAKKMFWEENFSHCLLFERRHVYRSFMVREGRWHSADNPRVERIPRTLVESLDHLVQYADGEVAELNIEDEQARAAFLAVERADLPYLVLRLPETLKSVVLLIFWEGRTEKDTARLLAISDRTVRNRLRQALRLLHRKLAGAYANE